MFKKEAEEWVNKEYDNSYYPDCNYSAKRDAEQAYIAGAEFGYNKAKEIIKDYMTIVKGAHTTVCGVSEENRTIHVLQLNEEAEQFLSEVEE